MKNCNKKSCIISVVALFIFFAAYELVINMYVLKDMYMQTATLWRPLDEIHQLMYWSFIRYAVMAMVLTCLFKKFRKGYAACKAECPTTGAAASAEAKTSCCPIKSGGACFGIKIGLLIAALKGGAYVYLPIPGELAIAWAAAGFVEGLGAGIILGMVCKGTSGTCETK